MMLIYIGNCGGAGICGTCAVKVLSGSENINPPSKNEQNTLKGIFYIYVFYIKQDMNIVSAQIFNVYVVYWNMHYLYICIQYKICLNNVMHKFLYIKYMSIGKPADFRLSCCARVSGPISIKTKP